MIVVLSFLMPALSAALFAGASYIGVELSRLIHRLFAKPPSAMTGGEPRLVWMLAGGGSFGLLAAMRGMDWQMLFMAAVLAVSLAGCWHSVATYGRMPDFFTLAPIAAIALSAIALQSWGALWNMSLAFAPFAIAAYLCKGKGLGWDDAKLAALGGAILGLEAAVIAFVLAGMAGVAVAWARKRTREPIPFGAYMIAMIALSLLINIKA